MFKTKAGTELQILNLRGKNYLPVQQRVLWFREEHPDWSIETELKSTENATLAKCTIKDASGRIIATGHKYEDREGFADHREKSESGAVGRALGFCGYGTQFALELEEGTRIMDAPQNSPRRTGPSPQEIGQRNIVKAKQMTLPQRPA